jgi:hypothetical protein
LALPLPGLTRPGSQGGGAPVAPMAGSKRQKVQEQVKVEVSESLDERLYLFEAVSTAY